MNRAVEAYAGPLLLSIVFYDEKEILKREKQFQHVGGKLFKSDSRYYLPDGSLNEQWLSDYDSLGRIAATRGLNLLGKPLGDGVYRYEYDEAGRKSRILSYGEREDDGVLNGVTVYQYETDDVGKLGPSAVNSTRTRRTRPVEENRNAEALLLSHRLISPLHGMWLLVRQNPGLR